MFAPVDNADVLEVPDDMPGKFTDCSYLPEAHRNTGSVGCQAQDKETGIGIAPHITPVVDGFEQGGNLPGLSVRVIFSWFAKDIDHTGFHVCALFRPEHSRAVADLRALRRTLAQQVIERGGVGEDGTLTNR